MTESYQTHVIATLVVLRREGIKIKFVSTVLYSAFIYTCAFYIYHSSK
jgi:hypothetical protein